MVVGGAEDLTNYRHGEVSSHISSSLEIKAEAEFEGQKEGKCKRNSMWHLLLVACGVLLMSSKPT